MLLLVLPHESLHVVCVGGKTHSSLETCHTKQGVFNSRCLQRVAFIIVHLVTKFPYGNSTHS